MRRSKMSAFAEPSAQPLDARNSVRCASNSRIMVSYSEVMLTAPRTSNGPSTAISAAVAMIRRGGDRTTCASATAASAAAHQVAPTQRSPAVLTPCMIQMGIGSTPRINRRQSTPRRPTASINRTTPAAKMVSASSSRLPAGPKPATGFGSKLGSTSNQRRGVKKTTARITAMATSPSVATSRTMDVRSGRRLIRRPPGHRVPRVWRAPRVGSHARRRRSPPGPRSSAHRRAPPARAGVARARCR